MRIRTHLPAFSLFLGIAAAILFADDASPKTFKVVIFHTNDIHGQVFPQKATWTKAENPPEVGGLAALAATIRRERAKEWNAGNAVFLVDAGDCFQGTPEGDIPRGRLVVEWMNLAGYDLQTVGNHEFDKGWKVVEDLSAVAKFPILGANVRWENGRRPEWLHDTKTYSVSGVDITFIGVTTSDMKTVCVPESIAGLTFEDELKTISSYIKDDGAVVIPVTHCGVERDRQLAKSLHVPAIIGGHSHSGIPNPVPSPTGCLVCQCYAHGSVLGRIELDFEGGKLVRTTAGHIPVRPADGEDPEAKALIARYSREISVTMDVVIGSAPEPLGRSGAGSSPLGNWLCDVMREKTKAQVAFHNRAGIRADVAAGSIRLRDMYGVSPFSNTLVTVDLTGADLDAILELAVMTSQHFLEVAGLECEIDTKAAEGSRVTITKVAAEPWDATRTYRVVTNSFLAKGGDGQVTFLKGKNSTDTGIDMLDAQVEACKAGPVKGPTDLRVKIR